MLAADDRARYAEHMEAIPAPNGITQIGSDCSGLPGDLRPRAATLFGRFARKFGEYSRETAAMNMCTLQEMRAAGRAIYNIRNEIPLPKHFHERPMGLEHRTDRNGKPKRPKPAAHWSMYWLAVLKWLSKDPLTGVTLGLPLLRKFKIHPGQWDFVGDRFSKTIVEYCEQIGQVEDYLPGIYRMLSAASEAACVHFQEYLVSPSNTTAPARHGCDYRSVVWFGTDYTFSSYQAACVAVLWDAWQNGTPEVGDDTVLMKAECETKRLRDMFRSHPAWRNMIIVGKSKGTHRLSGPIENPT